MATDTGGRAITDKQAADLAKQAGKYIGTLPHSAKGVTVKTGKIYVEHGRVRIAKDDSA